MPPLAPPKYWLAFFKMEASQEHNEKMVELAFVRETERLKHLDRLKEIELKHHLALQLENSKRRF